MDIKTEILEAVKSGRETKHLKNYIRNIWDNVQQGLECCHALAKINELQLTDKQRKISYQIVERIQGATFRLLPEKLLEIAEVYYDFVKETGDYFSPVILYANKEEINKSVHLIDAYINTQLLNIEFHPNSEADPKKIEKIFKMDYMFSPLALKRSDKEDWILAAWPNFLQGVAKGQPEALRAFEDLCTLYAMVGKMIYFEFVPFSKWGKCWDMSSEKQSLGGMISFGLSAIDKKGRIKIPVQDELLDIVLEKFNEVHAKHESQNQKVITFLRWWDKNSRRFAKQRRIMWREIIENPKYGLRTEGRDKIKIELESFESQELGMGHDFLQLFPEAEFPRASAKFWWRILGHPISIIVMLNPDNDTVIHHPIFSLFGGRDSNYWMRLIGEVRYFLALSSYWQIITGQRKGELAAGEESNARRRKVQTHTVVRPHFRTLQPGFKASEEAKERSHNTFGVIPPSEKTFVREHEKGWREAESIEPLFTITDQDLGYQT